MANHIPKFHPGQTVTFTAEGAITGGQIVECGTAARSVKVAGAASAKAIGTAAFDAIAGDKVTVEMTPYDLDRGRITFRHKDERASSMPAGAGPQQRRRWR